MKNKKQSSIEYLLSYMKNNQYFIGNDLLKAFEQAKALHKEEIKEAVSKGEANIDGYGEYIERNYKEQYYNETFKSE